MAEPLSLSEVIGLNARRIRLEAGLTLDQVAVTAREHGLKWSESRVADLESGRVAPSLGTLFPLAVALKAAGGIDVTIPDFFSTLGTSDDRVEVTELLTLRTSDLHRLVQGLPAKRLTVTKKTSKQTPAELITDPREEAIAAYYSQRTKLSTLAAVRRSSGATEARVARDLSMSSMLLAVLSTCLWRRSFSEERDRRSGESASPQKRGRVTRVLKDELRHSISEALDGNS